MVRSVPEYLLLGVTSCSSPTFYGARRSTESTLDSGGERPPILGLRGTRVNSTEVLFGSLSGSWVSHSRHDPTHAALRVLGPGRWVSDLK